MTDRSGDRPDKRPDGSIAGEAFEAALSVLHLYSPEHPAMPPAIQYEVPNGRFIAIDEDWLPAATDQEPTDAPEKRDTIAAASRRIRAGEQTCRDLLSESLAAVELHDAALNALAELTDDAAKATADALDDELARGQWRGPLHGIPITIKDVIDVEGVPTRAGSDAYLDVPLRDASGVALLRAAGAVIIGKSTTHEFALGVTSPQSRNPHDPSRIPGGSSGGSAIALATGMGLGSLGTDTRASIRVPAALSGVVGLKPTFGAIPTDGVVPLSWTMDHVAPMAGTVQDAAFLLDALIPDQGAFSRWANAPVTGLRLGVPEAAFDGADPEIDRLVRAAVEALEQAGCTVEPVKRPSADDFERANSAGLIISRCEAATFHRSLGADRSVYWQEVAEQLDEADGIFAVDYLDAQRMRADLAAGLLRCFDEVDVLAMPTSPIAAPLRDDFARYLTILSRNAIPWSLVGFPAMSVPCGFTAAGLPVGIQLVTPPGTEHRLVAVGSAIP